MSTSSIDGTVAAKQPTVRFAILRKYKWPISFGLGLLTCGIIIVIVHVIVFPETNAMEHDFKNHSMGAAITSHPPDASNAPPSPPTAAPTPRTTDLSAQGVQMLDAPVVGSIASGTPLRIMCLGASIVKGETSPTEDGFRPALRSNLTFLGGPVNLVGSVKHGAMLDNDVEAYSGFRVDQIFARAREVVPNYLPNIFVINDGTNNALQQNGVDTAGTEMENFINYLLAASPRAFVVLSTLLTNTVQNARFEPHIVNINSQYRYLVDKFATEGKRVLLAEMHPSSGLPGRPVVADIGPDGTHPFLPGYEKVARIMVDAVREGDRRGWLQVAEPVNGIPADGATAS